jgi:methyl halide transferase
LHAQGYADVTLLDIAAAPLLRFHQTHPDFPKARLLQGDFFLHQGQYDLILEQTFFCAIHPSLRKAYVEKMHTLLKPGGTLAGLLFGVEMSTEGPPFGGSKAEYEALFSPSFILHKLEACYNSIPPRSGKELFMRIERKD